jgi:hypothetical protein
MKVSLRQPHRAPGAEGAGRAPAAGFLDPRGPFLVLGGMEVGSPAVPIPEGAVPVAANSVLPPAAPDSAPADAGDATTAAISAAAMSGKADVQRVAKGAPVATMSGTGPVGVVTGGPAVAKVPNDALDVQDREPTNADAGLAPAGGVVVPPTTVAVAGVPVTAAAMLTTAVVAVPTGIAVAARGCAGAGAPVVPLRVRADTMFGPRGVALGPGGGPLVVCDTGHHRLLLWHKVPERDGAPADLVLGQADFISEGRNGRGRPGPATFNVPTGVVVERDLLIVADAWNHRVLIWHRLPKRSNAPADVVLGQADFTAVDANRGRSVAGAETLNWCYGVALVGDRLVVADTGNRRVLIWNCVPTANGQPADLVLGQRDFQCRDEIAGGEPGIVGMRWPHAASGWSTGGLQVADAGNHRILLWRAWPAEHGTPPDLVLGQRDLTASEPNGGGYWPDAATLNMPYGLTTVECEGGGRGGVENEGRESAVAPGGVERGGDLAGGGWLVAADTANSRLLAWPAAALATGAAVGLSGQDDFGAKGDNRWHAPARDSLCWPYSVSARDGILAIADSGNNRVVLWRLALADLGSGTK